MQTRAGAMVIVQASPWGLPCLGLISPPRNGMLRRRTDNAAGTSFRTTAAACTPPRAAGRAMRGAMNLCFGGQFVSQPLRIRGGLGVAHIYRPFLRQTNLAKHRVINPQVALAPPEHRMLDAFLGLPGPGFLTPKRAVLVAPRLYKPQKIVVRYVVVVDGELAHLDFMRAKFVVPTEFISVTPLQSQHTLPARHLHQMRLHPERFPRRSLGTASLPGARQSVQHVRERLRMHQPVLDRHFHHRDQLQMPFPGPFHAMPARPPHFPANPPASP